MNSEISRRAGKHWQLDKRTQGEIAEVVSEVRVEDVKLAGSMWLAERVMEHMSQLDETRRAYGRHGSPELNAALMEIEVIAFNQAATIQRNLFRNGHF